jgi:hypothetical protein
MTADISLARAPRAPAGERHSTHRAVAAVAALVAGLVHLTVAVPGFGASLPLGGFFLAVSLGQIGFARAVRSSHSMSVLVCGAVAHLAMITLYVASRTVDLAFLPVRDDVGPSFHHLPVAGGVGNGTPIVPDAHIQPVGIPDLVCLLAELLVVAMIVALLPGRPRRLVTDLMLVLGVAGLVARVAGA